VPESHSGQAFEFLAQDRSLRDAHIATLSRRRQLLHVAVLSGLGLFCELLFIRWLDAEIRFLAYVKNLPLIASFLGLGIGFAIANRKRSSFSLAVPLLALVVVMGVIFAKQTSLGGPKGPETNLGILPTQAHGVVVFFYILITMIFTSVVAAMIPLGQVAGEYMQGLDALPCYTANIGGALGGIGLFVALSGLWIPPWVSAVFVFAVCVGYIQHRGMRRLAVPVGLLAVIAMAWVDHGETRTIWSPYNKINVKRLDEVEVPEHDPVDI